MNDVILVDLESEDPRWARALPVLRELRPQLTEELFTRVMREAGPQGLRFTAVFAGERCVAIAGWRIVANTSAIRKLYIDDLSTAAADRSRGYGRMLMDELRERAVAAGCRSLELDSGVQRFDAHRFYLRERMSITAHHFDLEL